MKTKASDIAEYAKQSIASLARHPHYGSLNAVVCEIAANSGLGKSTVQKIYDGRKPNPTVSTLDKMVAGIKVATRKAAK